ncbi:hypothetical protein KKA95_04430 [Patescibacteria group bacterium]|nr:hypothetical protein [Patescibacteria group bacterium]
MSFLDKIKGWFGGKGKESQAGTTESAFQQQRKEFSEVFSDQKGTYEEKTIATREEIQAKQARKEVEETLLETPVPESLQHEVTMPEIKPKAVPKFKMTKELVQEYLSKSNDPLGRYILNNTDAKVVDKDYMARIKHELLERPELLEQKTGRFYCPPLEDYLRVMGYSYVPEKDSKYSEIDYLVERILSNVAHDIEWSGKVEEIQKEVVNEYMDREEDPFGKNMKEVLGVENFDENRKRVVYFAIKENPVTIEHETCFELEDYIRAMGKTNEEAIRLSREILRRAYIDISAGKEAKEEIAATGTEGMTQKAVKIAS